MFRFKLVKTASWFLLGGCYCFYLVFASSKCRAQSELYEQTSEMGTTMVSYQRDIAAIQDFYSPMSSGGGFSSRGATYASPEQRKRLIEINTDYLAKLKGLTFDKFSIYGKVDYILFKKAVTSASEKLREDVALEQRIQKYIPFANEIYELEKQRRRGKYLEGAKVAAQLTKIMKRVDSATLASKKSNDILAIEIATTNKAILGLVARLKNFTEFYVNYDPDFTWWVPKPAEDLSLALTKYAANFDVKVERPVGNQITGVPIGKEELQRQITAEMLPYTPEQLIQLAEKEFAYCDKELLQASKEMGFGPDPIAIGWKKAQEKVKNSYVPLGKQPELIVKLQDDALDFIKANQLMDIPALANETWGMIMMTAQRQLVNPFFTGGREISISYPTQTMSQEDKLMSMRGNNPYFSRGTVQHELLPGHHLQYFMTSRYKNYRNAFSTPFSVEGWPLYWELLLYEKGFAKTPEEKIGMLFWRMHRCARILFSLNFHLGKWTPQQCVDFLVDRVGHERANAEGEVRRSFAGGYSPLYQVAYLVGGLQIMSLKREVVDKGKMSYKQFHEAFMKENQIPIEMVRATLTNQALTRDYTTQWKFYQFAN
ncbi:MAG: DUF885 family protein [Chitinophagaceae bacterium]|nr:MAG: DUF885 family protein [Chitinophagaceae bacterium]